MILASPPSGPKGKDKLRETAPYGCCEVAKYRHHCGSPHNPPMIPISITHDPEPFPSHTPTSGSRPRCRSSTRNAFPSRLSPPLSIFHQKCVPKSAIGPPDPKEIEGELAIFETSLGWLGLSCPPPAPVLDPKELGTTFGYTTHQILEFPTFGHPVPLQFPMAERWPRTPGGDHRGFGLSKPAGLAGPG